MRILTTTEYNEVCKSYEQFGSKLFDEIVEESVNEDKPIIEQLVKEVTSNDINLNVQL